MKTEKYVVRVMRPIFQTVDVVVEAYDEDEAMETVLKQAHTIEKKYWKGDFKRREYSYDVQQVRELNDDTNDEDCEFFDSVTDETKYLILKADTDSGEGKVLYEPWMKKESDLMIADLCMDWSEELENTREEEANKFFRKLEADINNNDNNITKKPLAKIIPFTIKPDNKK